MTILQGLHNPQNKELNNLTITNATSVLQIATGMTTIQWIPTHCSMPGNEAVDRLANINRIYRMLKAVTQWKKKKNRRSKKSPSMKLRTIVKQKQKKSALITTAVTVSVDSPEKSK